MSHRLNDAAVLVSVLQFNESALYNAGAAGDAPNPADDNDDDGGAGLDRDVPDDDKVETDYNFAASTATSPSSRARDPRRAPTRELRGG